MLPDNSINIMKFKCKEKSLKDLALYLDVKEASALRHLIRHNATFRENFTAYRNVVIFLKWPFKDHFDYKS